MHLAHAVRDDNSFFLPFDNMYLVRTMNHNRRVVVASNGSSKENIVTVFFLFLVVFFLHIHWRTSVTSNVVYILCVTYDSWQNEYCILRVPVCPLSHAHMAKSLLSRWLHTHTSFAQLQFIILSTMPSTIGTYVPSYLNLSHP